jgi:hypothetical protein
LRHAICYLNHCVSDILFLSFEVLFFFSIGNFCNFLYLTLVFFIFIFVVRGLELMAYTLRHSPSPFCVMHFQDRVCKLFSWAGFKLQSSWCLPPE